MHNNEIQSKAYLWLGGAFIVAGLLMVLVFKGVWYMALPPIIICVALFSAPLLINFLPKGVLAIWHSATPKWAGEIMLTDGGDAQLRYGLNDDGTFWFVARDVCAAIGIDPPDKRARQWHGQTLVMHHALPCMTESGIEHFLQARAIDDADARRLLTLIKQQILRKRDVERERTARFG